MFAVFWSLLQRLCLLQSRVALVPVSAPSAFCAALFHISVSFVYGFIQVLWFWLCSLIMLRQVPSSSSLDW